MSLEQARFNMIEQQVRPWDVLDQSVLEAMKSVPRENFVPPHQRAFAFTDTEIRLKHDQVMMPPRVEGRMLQELAINSDDVCLEIGTGSGYVTACMATLGKEVHSVEYYDDLSFEAQESLDRQGIYNAHLHVGDASEDWNMQSELFDVIAITASMPVYNPTYEQKLKLNGRLFVVVGNEPNMSAMLITRTADNAFSRVSLFEMELPALIGVNIKRAFVF